MICVRTISMLVLASLILSFAGCGTKYQPVTGEIVFPDGTPVMGLTGGQIIFQRVGNPAEKSASAAIDENGKFTLGTDDLADGAMEGEYEILITVPAPTGDEQPVPIIDPKYSKAGGMTEKFTVKKGKNHFKVTVEKAP